MIKEDTDSTSTKCIMKEGNKTKNTCSWLWKGLFIRKIILNISDDTVENIDIDNIDGIGFDVESQT